MITDEVLTDLEAKAKAATPGPWKTEEIWHEVVVLRAGEYAVLELQRPTPRDRDDMQHIAAANPEVVLALVARIRELEELARDVESITADVAKYGTQGDCPYVTKGRAGELLAIIRRGRP